MLSILIPAYNYDCTLLVKDLHKQVIECKIPFEIIVAEDGSTKFTSENQQITTLIYCKHIVLQQNIGRAAIRNFLAKKAIFENLLFIDCDSKIVSNDYIETYIKHLGKIVLGGRIYNKPSSKNHTLLPKYGARERIKKEREGEIFTSPNFLIPKHIFDTVRFDENITQYGHEDTLFGCALHHKGFNFFLIDNPILHDSIEDNITFLHKTELSINNLLLLIKRTDDKELQKISKLYRCYQKLHKIKLTSAISTLFISTRELLQKQLCSSTPSLFLFNLYKIGYLCHIASKSQDFLTENV